MGTEAPIMAAWEEVLASFALCLKGHRKAFGVLSSDQLHDPVVTDMFIPPQGLPPLPEELLPRAELLMLEARALERAELTHLKNLRRRALTEVPRQGPRRPSMLDAHG